MIDLGGKIFVGGAPRTGTTLIMNLLDGHPNLIVFPVEHDVFRRYWHLSQEEKVAYFQERFLDPSQGQQALLANVQAARLKEQRLSSEFGTNFSLAVDNETATRFKMEFKRNIGLSVPTLQGVINSLGSAYYESSRTIKSHVKNPKYMVFKHPFFTELYATLIAEQIRGAKFVHLVRHPMARYSSAKNRRIRPSPTGGGVSPRINSVNFVAGHVEVSASSYSLALHNFNELGSNTYKIIHYEDLVRDPKSIVQDLANWLEIDFDPCLLLPTQNGNEVKQRSHVNHGGGGVIDNSELMHRQFKAVTSPFERMLFDYYTSLTSVGQLYGINQRSRRQVALGWWRKFLGERPQDYVSRMVSWKYNPLIMNSLEIAELLSNRLINIAKSNQAEMSGSL